MKKIKRSILDPINNHFLTHFRPKKIKKTKAVSEYTKCMGSEMKVENGVCEHYSSQISFKLL